MARVPKYFDASRPQLGMIAMGKIIRLHYPSPILGYDWKARENNTLTKKKSWEREGVHNNIHVAADHVDDDELVRHFPPFSWDVAGGTPGAKLVFFGQNDTRSLGAAQ